MKKSVLAVVFASVFIGGFPLFADAAFPLEALIARFGLIVDSLIGVVASLALLVFFWGIVKYIASADDEKSKDSGKRLMIGGVIGLFVMFSVFGLIRFIREAFDINNNSDLNPPGLGL